MRSFYRISITSLFFLVACNDVKKPNSENFTNAVNQYLTKHGEVCAMLGRQFPTDIPEREAKDQYGIGPKLAALEVAGLLHATDTTAVVHGMMDALRGLTPSQPVKHYELTPEGQKYFHLIPTTFGSSGGFCYGQKSVDSIVKWTEPPTRGSSSQTEVTYTYKLVDVATWAQRSDVQEVFSDIRTTINGALKTPEAAGLQLTSNGWEVLGQ